MSKQAEYNHENCMVIKVAYMASIFPQQCLREEGVKCYHIQNFLGFDRWIVFDRWI